MFGIPTRRVVKECAAGDVLPQQKLTTVKQNTATRDLCVPKTKKQKTEQQEED